MKNVILILVMMLGLNVTAQVKAFDINFYPTISVDTIPFADSLHTETSYNMDTYVKLIFLYINEERRIKGLNPLVMSKELTLLAQKHSDNMAKTRIYKHSGLNYNEVITNLSGILYLTQKDLAGIAIKQWMESDAHRDALLNPNFKTFGIGVQENKSGFTTDGGNKHNVTHNTYYTVIFNY